MTRIIAGEWGGRRLEVPPGIRPMQDRERERLFSILAPRMEGAAFLDVFAGSGAIGLEALSRGARWCTFVENGHKVLAVLRRNLEALGAARRARVLPISAFGLHKSGEPGQGSVDIAVLAPPFPLLEDEALRPRLDTLFSYVARQLLAPGGRLILEHPSRMTPPLLHGTVPPEDTRLTAASALSFYASR
ncbi:MAG: RsmD family RNA methyltransferase [Planctomycetota bacterium]